MLRSQCWHADRVAKIGLLVASLAHELSQPLAAMLGNAQAGLRILSQEPLDKNEMHALLRDIVQDNHSARHIIDVLRAMIRKKSAVKIAVDTADIVRETMALLHRQFLTHKVKVELACDDQCVIYADKVQIQQVLLNIIMNSIDALRTCPVNRRRVQISVRKAMNPAGDNQVQFSVHDTGPGIPADQLPHVFDAFWTTKPEGLGLGLAICRSIIEHYAGRIWAENNDVNGVTFYFSLPVAAM